MYIDDMLRIAEKARRSSAGIDRGTMQQDGVKYDAILRNLKLIREASSN